MSFVPSLSVFLALSVGGQLAQVRTQPSELPVAEKLDGAEARER